MAFIKGMALVTNFFPSALMKRLPNIFCMVIGKAREDGFSFCSAVELYLWQTGRKAQGLVKTCIWISSATEQNYTFLTLKCWEMFKDWKHSLRKEKNQ